TGLGLATSYGIVKQCQGSISVLSEPGHGTTIKVFLPCASEPQTTAADDSSAVTVHDGDETLLLVEDEEFVRRFTAQLLTARGYRVIVAATPAEALELAGEHLEDIDLIVTDVVMPGMSGGQLVRQLKESKPGLSVIFISGYSEDEVIHRGLANSRMHFLQKPFTPIDLTRLVREVLDSGKLSTQ
ncbi:MAG TPA: response regulator, partial [Pseudomonadales bacterium]|nr:response regulator [Pseudomonadales bacterium]